MHIKYSPCNANKDTVITIKSFSPPELITIDGIDYGPFDTDGVEWPNIVTETDGTIIEAHRDSSGELYLTVLRFYSGSCFNWDTGDYQEVTA